jgi:hypothetical protein
MSDHLRRANDELEGYEDSRPNAEEILPPTDEEVAASVRWLQENSR